MGKKTPEELKAEAAEVEDYITTARKKPLNFALLIAAEGVVLKAHATKDTEVLWRQAKAEGGGAKGAAGVMNTSGKVIQMTCTEDDVPTSLPRLARKHFKDLGLNFAISMVLPGGGQLYDGEESEEGALKAEMLTAGPVPIDEDDTNAPVVDEVRKAELAARLKATVEPVKVIAAKDAERGGKLVAAIRAAQGELGAGRLDPAERVIVAVEQAVIPKPPPPPPGGPKPAKVASTPTQEEVDEARAQLRVERASLETQLALFIKRGEPSLAGKAQKLRDGFDQGIDTAEPKRLAQVLSTLRNFLAAHSPNLPPVSRAEQAQDAIAAAKGQREPPERKAKAVAIQGKYPDAAADAAGIYDQLASVLGDAPVTDLVQLAAQKDIETARGGLDAPKARLAKAEALKPGPDRDAAVLEAQGDLVAAQARLDATIAFEKACRVKMALDEALTAGPLSPASGKKLSPTLAASLVQGFAQNPAMAKAATAISVSAKHPGALESGLGMVAAMGDGGFAHGKNKMDAKDSDAYGIKLLRMGAQCGQDYFDRLPDYVTSGRQFDTDPMGDKAAASGAAKAQMRSVKMAEGLIGPGGSVDATSATAKAAIGDLLFNPEVLKEPMPNLGEHVLKTAAFLADPANAADASVILQKMPVPTGGSKALVGMALGKGTTHAATKDEAQIAVMASMLKPITQAKVGSCFATGPLKRQRELDPLATMQGYADVASKGTYTPAQGVAVPVVTRIPPGEDPVMRSLEYSVATSNAREEGSHVRKLMGLSCFIGATSLATDITKISAEKERSAGGIFGFGKSMVEYLSVGPKIKAMNYELFDSMEPVYDATLDTPVSADGSSSKGRWVLRRKDNGKDILDENEFARNVAEVAKRVSGFQPGSPEEKKLTDEIFTWDFVKLFKFGENAPWAMDGGGLGEDTLQRLGQPAKKSTMVSSGKDSVPEGKRTTDFVADMLGSMTADMPDMVCLETPTHSFNLTPNDPSLDKLKAGGKGKFAQNIKTELVDKGKAEAAKKMPIEQAVHLYKTITDKLLDEVKGKGTEMVMRSGIAANMPTAEMTPAELDAAVAKAVEVSNQRRAAAQTKPDEWAKWLKGQTENAVADALFEDMDLPQVSFADTNWGDAESATLFVIAPDPRSGEPKMWMKTVPPGTMRPAGRKWLDANWELVK